MSIALLASFDATFFAGRVLLPSGGGSILTRQNAAQVRPCRVTISSNGDFTVQSDSISVVAPAWCSVPGFQAGLNFMVRLVTGGGNLFASGSSPINQWLPCSISPSWSLAKPGAGQSVTAGFGLEFSANVTYPEVTSASTPWLMTHENTG